MVPLVSFVLNSLPIEILLILPSDQHLASHFFEHSFIPLAEQARPVADLSFGQEGGNIFVAAGLPFFVRVGRHLGLDYLLKRFANLLHAQEFPKSFHFIKWGFEQILIS